MRFKSGRRPLTGKPSQALTHLRLVRKSQNDMFVQRKQTMLDKEQLRHELTNQMFLRESYEQLRSKQLTEQDRIVDRIQKYKHKLMMMDSRTSHLHTFNSTALSNCPSELPKANSVRHRKQLRQSEQVYWTETTSIGFVPGSRNISSANLAGDS